MPGPCDAVEALPKAPCFGERLRLNGASHSKSWGYASWGVRETVEAEPESDLTC